MSTAAKQPLTRLVILAALGGAFVPGTLIVADDGGSGASCLDQETTDRQPRATRAAQVQAGLSKGKIAVFNEYTARFEVIDAVYFRNGNIRTMAPLAYECDSNTPTLVPLSDLDPDAAREAFRSFKKQTRNVASIAGLDVGLRPDDR